MAERAPTQLCFDGVIEIANKNLGHRSPRVAIMIAP
jgi:hypothetical protein